MLTTKRLHKNKYHQSQRGYFAGELYNHMIHNKDIFVITADLGYGMFDNIRDTFSNRFINTGASEQAAMGISIGLAKEGRIPFVYSIAPFLLYRAHELIRNYVNRLDIPVKLIGGGRDDDYKHDGFSHNASDVDVLFNHCWKNIETHWPETKEEVPEILDKTISNRKPTFISLRR